MTVSSYTPNFALGIVDFNSPIWSDDINRNWRVVDAVISGIGMPVLYTNAVGTNDLTLTYSPPIVAYTSGLRISFLLANAPTGAMTVNANGLGVRDLIYRGNPIVSGDLDAGVVVDAVYDGTQFNLLGLIRQEFQNLSIVDNLSGGTANALANQLIVENNTDTGISILTPNTEKGTIAFGNNSNNLAAFLQYDHLAEELLISGPDSTITIGGDMSFDADDSVYNFQFGASVFRLAVAVGNVIRLGGSLSTSNGVFIDLSTGRVGIGTNNPTTVLEVNGTVKASSFEGGLNLSSVVGVLPVTGGGTGGTTAALARDNLGIGDVGTKDTIDNADWNPAGARLAVSNGGTGANTLTGYVKGNGTGPFTASATIPYADISGTPTDFTGDASDIVTGVFDDAVMGVDENFAGGSITLPGGIIFKWGTTFVAGDSLVGVTFPVAFPNGVFVVLAQAISTVAGPGNNQGSVGVSSYTTAGFTLANDGDSRSHYWMAIGN